MWVRFTHGASYARVCVLSGCCVGVEKVVGGGGEAAARRANGTHEEEQAPRSKLC